jgi:hypothetical protein
VKSALGKAWCASENPSCSRGADASLKHFGLLAPPWCKEIIGAGAQLFAAARVGAEETVQDRGQAGLLEARLRRAQRVDET